MPRSAPKARAVLLDTAPYRPDCVSGCHAGHGHPARDDTGTRFAVRFIAAVSLHPLALVADDDDSSLRLLAAWLADLGYEVHLARDGVELLECLEQLEATGALAAPFLVVTDLEMPRKNGLSVLGTIRERFAGARVLMVTAFGDARVHTQARSLGAAAILDKPFNMSRFLSTVTETLPDAPASRSPSGMQDSERSHRGRRAPAS